MGRALRALLITTSIRREDMNDETINKKNDPTGGHGMPTEEHFLKMLHHGLRPEIPEGADWRWTLAAGVLMVIGGTVGVLYGSLATIASVIFFGAGLVSAGMLHIVSMFRKEDARKGAWVENLLMAAMYGAMGAWILLDPMGATAGLTLMLCVFFAVIALMRFSLAWKRRAQRGEMLSQMLGGIMALGLMGVVIASWPLSTLWAIGVMVSVELLMNGWILVFAALSLRKSMQRRDAEKELEHA